MRRPENIRPKATPLRAVGAIACAGALALACTPVAWAADNVGTTEVTVQADPNALLAFRVPTLIPFYAAPDGTLTGPSPEACQVVNESVFGIHVTKVDVVQKGGWTLSSNAASGSNENAMDFQFGRETQVDAFAARAGYDVSDDVSFNMGYVGSGKEAIDIDTQGDVARVTLDLSEPVPSATVSWTVAPGFATAS